MDAQLKRGMLEVCVLTAVSKGDSYGYRIVKEVSPYIEISESTLYPILRRLEAAGNLEAYSVEHNGRLRKYYRITGEGRERIAEFLQSRDMVMGIYRYIEEGSQSHEEE